MDARDKLLATIEENREVAGLSPSPFYERLLVHMAADVKEGGPTWTLLEPYAGEPTTEYYPFRALAGVHHEVLAGERPELAVHYPSAGGDGDADAAWPGVRAAYEGRDPDVLADLRHPLQTNETSRCGALAGGFCVVAEETGLPLRIRELGASAGLNMHFDSYRYEAGGAGFGPEDSPVRFADYWEGGVPPLGAAPEVADRAGCDLDPVDATSEQGRIALQSYVWPDEAERLSTLRSALEIAASRPVRLDRESADTWIERELAEPAEGLATVVYHSVFWVYVPAPVRERIERAVRGAGEAASEGAPVGWLRYEEGADPLEVELRLTMWPGGEERLLGIGRHHRHPVRWLA